MPMCNSSSLGIALQRVIPSCSILGSSAFEGRGAAHNVYFLDEITTEDPLWPGWVSRAIRTLWSNVNSEYRHLSFIAEHCEHYEVMCILRCRGTCHSLQMVEGQHTRKGTRLCNRIAVEKCCWEIGLWWKGGTCCGSQELLGRLNQQSKHPSPSFLTTSAMTASSGAFCKEDYKTSAEKPGGGGQNRLLKASECIQCVYLEERLKLQ